MSDSADLLTRAAEAMAILEIDIPNDGLQILRATALIPPQPASATIAPAWCEVQGVAPYMPPIVPYPVHPMYAVLVVCDRDTRLEALRETLLVRYPPMHPLSVVCCGQGREGGCVWHGSLAGLTDAIRDAMSMTLFVPPLPMFADQRGFAALEWVVVRLLGLGGCPWDRKQTFQSLRAGLLEEVYEVLEALDCGDMAALTEELGDLLLQVFVYGEMGRQAGHFTLGDVLEQVTSKLIRRHPHVFGDLDVQDSEDVLTNWEAIKSRELREKGRERVSALDGVPSGLPALAAAQKYSKKAMRTGFTWGTLGEVWANVYEEVGELAQACARWDDTGSAEDAASVADEMGDVLFSIVALASWLKVDAESVLRAANKKFYDRFTTMERLVCGQGRGLLEMSTEELLALWAEAKREEQRV